MRLDQRFVLGLAVVIGLGIGSVAPLLAQQSNATAEEGVAVGRQAPDFTVPTKDGEFKLSDHRGKHVVAIFVRAHW